MAAPIPIILAALGMKFGGDAIQQGRQRKAESRRLGELGDLVSGMNFGAGADPRRINELTRAAASRDPNIAQTAFEQLEAMTPSAMIDQSNALALAGVEQIKTLNAQQKSIFDQEKTLRTDYNAVMQPIINSQMRVNSVKELVEMEGNPLAGFNILRQWYNQIDESMITQPEIASFMQAFGAAGHWAQLKAFFTGEGEVNPEMARMAYESMLVVQNAMDAYGEAYTKRTIEMVKGYNMTAEGIGSSIRLDPSRVVHVNAWERSPEASGFTGTTNGTGTETQGTVINEQGEEQITVTGAGGLPVQLGPVKNRN